jgi:hypothetical protein
MDAQTEREDRLLSAAEHEMVAQTRPPVVGQLSKEALQVLGKRLREARDRSRRVASQQQREMRGKTSPRGATPARDNTGSLGKTEVLVAALKRVTAALRAIAKPTPTPAQLLHTVQEARKAEAAQRPGPGRTASKGMQVKASQRPTVQMDPREIGRVSQATKVGQAKRGR